VTAREMRGGGGGVLNVPKRPPKHRVGDTFQLDGEQLNPSTAGHREEERWKRQKKKRRR